MTNLGLSIGVLLAEMSTKRGSTRGSTVHVHYGTTLALYNVQCRLHMKVFIVRLDPRPQ
jgi:hypothetical protein